MLLFRFSFNHTQDLGTTISLYASRKAFDLSISIPTCPLVHGPAILFTCHFTSTLSKKMSVDHSNDLSIIQLTFHSSTDLPISALTSPLVHQPVY